MPKLLRDFLHEQQEPFALDFYLLERGCNYSKISRFMRKKSSRNAVSNYTDFFKSVFNRLVSVKSDNKIKNSKNLYDQQGGREKHANDDYDDDEFSSASSRTVFKSLSATESEDTRDYYDVFPQKEVDAKTRLKRISVEDKSITKQLSPVSVLEETESDEEEADSPLHHKQKHFKTTIVPGESSSTSMPQHNRIQRLHHDLATSNSTRYDHQYVVNKRILHESQKLLIDTVREVIQVQRQRDKRHEQLKKILGPDELWKLVCEHLWIWSQDLTDETNIADLLHCDFLGSQEAWSDDYEMQKQVICEQVGDDILQEILVEIFWSY